MTASPFIGFLTKHKYVIIISLMIVNVLCYGFIKRQKLAFHGTIEIPNYSWIVYSTQFDDLVTTTFSYIKKDKPEQHNSFVIPYQFDKISKNTYLLKNDDTENKIHILTAYAIDELCSLIFRNTEKMTINNVHLSCHLPD